MIKLKLQDMTAESLYLAVAQRMNRHTILTFFNILEIVAAESNLYGNLGKFSSFTKVAYK
jgi:hypothetical protein